VIGSGRLALGEIVAVENSQRRDLRTRRRGLTPVKGLAVGADPNLSHRADRILSQGWKPVLN